MYHFIFISRIALRLIYVIWPSAKTKLNLNLAVLSRVSCKKGPICHSSFQNSWSWIVNGKVTFVVNQAWYWNPRYGRPPPQWNMWYWMSKCIFHTVCWGAIDCEWGTKSIYFEILFVYFITMILLLSLLWGPSTDFFFNFCPKFYVKDTNKIFKNPCRFRTWIGFIVQILIKLETSFIQGLLMWPLCRPLGSDLTCGHSVTTEVCTSLAGVLCGMGV